MKITCKLNVRPEDKFLQVNLNVTGWNLYSDLLVGCLRPYIIGMGISELKKGLTGEFVFNTDENDFLNPESLNANGHVDNDDFPMQVFFEDFISKLKKELTPINQIFGFTGNYTDHVQLYKIETALIQDSESNSFKCLNKLQESLPNLFVASSCLDGEYDEFESLVNNYASHFVHELSQSLQVEKQSEFCEVVYKLVRAYYAGQIHRSKPNYRLYLSIRALIAVTYTLFKRHTYLEGLIKTSPSEELKSLQMILNCAVKIIGATGVEIDMLDQQDDPDIYYIICMGMSFLDVDLISSYSRCSSASAAQ